MSRSREQIIVWLKGELAKKQPGRNQSALARHLGKDRSAITRILKGGQEISVTEYARMQEFFRSEPQLLLQQVAGVRMAGVLGDRVWTRPDEEPQQRYIGAVSTEYPISEQAAYTLFEQTPDGRYQAGDVVFTVPWDKYRTAPLADDLVVVKSERDGLVRYSLRIAVARGGRVSLTPLGDQSSQKHDDAEQPIGLMIGFYRPHRRQGS